MLRRRDRVRAEKTQLFYIGDGDFSGPSDCNLIGLPLFWGMHVGLSKMDLHISW